MTTDTGAGSAAPAAQKKHRTESGAQTGGRSRIVKKELELYVHIPFCVKKCAYCDFLSAPAGADERAAYVDALIREIRSKKENFREYRVDRKSVV